MRQDKPFKYMVSILFFNAFEFDCQGIEKHSKDFGLSQKAILADICSGKIVNAYYPVFKVRDRSIYSIVF